MPRSQAGDAHGSMKASSCQDCARKPYLLSFFLQNIFHFYFRTAVRTVPESRACSLPARSALCGGGVCWMCE